MADPSSTGIQNWQHLERLAAALQAKLDPGAEVVGSRKYDGRLSGSKRQIDASVFGNLGSVRLWIAIDAKHLGEEVDLPDIEKFHALLGDVGANKGIMITTIGYTPGALQRAALAGIDTCVFRPISDKDWDNWVQSFRIRVVLRSIAFDEGSAVLTLCDGRTIPGHLTTWLRDRDGEYVGLPDLVQAAIQQHMPTWDEGKTVEMSFESGAFSVVMGNDLAPLKSIACVPRRHDLDWNEIVIQNQTDWAFIKVLPGEVIAEKRFFEFAELDRLAEKFRPGGDA